MPALPFVDICCSVCEMTTGSAKHNLEFNTARVLRRRRNGAVTLEFILALPVLLIVLFGVVEFGMYFAGMQQVALACRVGTEAGSQTDLSTTTDGDPVPVDVLNAILQQLNSAGISACEVILEHDVQGPEQTLVSTFSPCICAAPATPLPVSPGAGGSSVRVTVCVPMTELAPNCLATFGFDFETCIASCSSTMRYELSVP